MKVMTFNIRGAMHADGDNVWDNRRELNIKTIQTYDPDIIGFQEFQQGNLDAYNTDLLQSYTIEPGNFSTRRDEQYERVPLLWKSDRFRKLDSGSFYLSETPETWSVGWQATFPRAANWVRLQVIDSGTEFVVLNAHYPHKIDVDETRANCSRLIVQQMQTIAAGAPSIIMADFNSKPTGGTYDTFLENGYTDTYRALGHSTAVNTFHDFLGETATYTGVRIDWIMVNGFSVTACDVITDAEPPIYPSDHYPVLAEVELG